MRFDILVWDIIQHANISTLSRFLTIASGIWKHRNLRTFDTADCIHDNIISTLKYVQNFQ